MISPIVTLTTDWGYSDFFAGAVKGRLYTDIPNVRVVDITHGIDPFSLRKAIFVVKNGCLSFPPGTIHIIDVCSSQTKEHPFVVVSYAQQYYICTDNGLPHAVFEDQYDKAVVIDGIRWDSDFYTFAARDLFCKVAAMIAADTPIEQLGLPVESFFKTFQSQNYIRLALAQCSLCRLVWQCRPQYYLRRLRALPSGPFFRHAFF